MKLFYRGIPYDHEPTQIDVIDSGIRGQYRGQSFDITYPRHIPVPQPILNLKYRGVAYRNTATDGAESVRPVKPTKSVKPESKPIFGRAETVADLSHSLFMKRQAVNSEVSKVHQQNIQRLLQHRLEVARAKGDQNLIVQLEHEMQHTV